MASHGHNDGDVVVGALLVFARSRRRDNGRLITDHGDGRAREVKSVVQGSRVRRRNGNRSGLSLLGHSASLLSGSARTASASSSSPHAAAAPGGLVGALELLSSNLLLPEEEHQDALAEDHTPDAHGDHDEESDEHALDNSGLEAESGEHSLVATLLLAAEVSLFLFHVLTTMMLLAVVLALLGLVGHRASHGVHHVVELANVVRALGLLLNLDGSGMLVQELARLVSSRVLHDLLEDHIKEASGSASVSNTVHGLGLLSAEAAILVDGLSTRAPGAGGIRRASVLILEGVASLGVLGGRLGLLEELRQDVFSELLGVVLIVTLEASVVEVVVVLHGLNHIDSVLSGSVLVGAVVLHTNRNDVVELEGGANGENSEQANTASDLSAHPEGSVRLVLPDGPASLSANHEDEHGHEGKVARERLDAVVELELVASNDLGHVLLSGWTVMRTSRHALDETVGDAASAEPQVRGSDRANEAGTLEHARGAANTHMQHSDLSLGGLESDIVDGSSGLLGRHGLRLSLVHLLGSQRRRNSSIVRRVGHCHADRSGRHGNLTIHIFLIMNIYKN